MFAFWWCRKVSPAHETGSFLIYFNYVYLLELISLRCDGAFAWEWGLTRIFPARIFFRSRFFEAKMFKRIQKNEIIIEKHIITNDRSAARALEVSLFIISSPLTPPLLLNLINFKCVAFYLPLNALLLILMSFIVHSSFLRSRPSFFRFLTKLCIERKRTKFFHVFQNST